MNNNTIEELNRRDLERCYIIIYIIPNEVYIEERINYIVKRIAYVIFGCTLDGRRKYITTVMEGEFKKTSEWYEFFQGLKGRKLEEIIFGLIPDKKELKEGIRLSFPKIEIFNSCDNTIEKLKKYKAYKERDGMLKAVRKLYLAEDKKEYEINYKSFVEEYREYPFIMDMIGEEIKKLEENYKYTKTIRNAIYSFNYVVEIKKRMSIYAHEKVYKSKEEFEKRYVGYIKASERQRHFLKEKWGMLLNEIYEEKKEMIKPYL